jgi:hypothetical protein
MNHNLVLIKDNIIVNVEHFVSAQRVGDELLICMKSGLPIALSGEPQVSNAWNLLCRFMTPRHNGTARAKEMNGELLRSDS